MANLRADNLTGSGGRNAIDGSVFFGGEEDQLQSATSSDFAFGTGAYTLEFWVKSGRPSGENGLFGSFTSSAYGIGIWHNGANLYFEERQNSYSGSNPRVTYSSFDWSNWNHLALSRDSTSGTMRAFVNGVQVGTVTSNLRDITATSETTVGHNNAAGNNAIAYISNLRLNNTQLYTAAFTPPTEKLKPIDGTVLLCCQDSDNPLQEATGKTITGAGGLDINETEYVTNGTFTNGYSPAWTAWGDTTTAQNGGIFIERTSTLTGVYQQLPTASMPAGQYKLRGIISNKTGPGGAIIRLSSATQGNGTNFFGAYGPGIIESTINYNGTSNLYMNLMLGNNTGSADFSNISFRQVYTAGDAPKVLPSVGVDAGVVFEGDTKVNSQEYMYFPTGSTEERGGYSGRMVVGGGEVNASPGVTSVIEYFNFAHFSNGVNFGSLTQARRKVASCSSSTRGIWAGGGSPGSTDRIDYVTIATTGDAIDFANLFTGVSDDSSQCFGGSNNTRGIFAGGYNNVDTIQYITIATTADAQDFGDLITGRFDHAGFASPTRAIFAGGKLTPHGNLRSIEFVTIATTGGGTNFGDMTADVRGPAGLSNNIRGLMAGGSAVTNSIEYLTIASTGRAKDFGDLLVAHQEILAGGSSNNTRGVWAGGQNPGQSSMLQSVMIQSMGNAIDFGNLTNGTSGAGSVSDSHGGLS